MDSIFLIRQEKIPVTMFSELKRRQFVSDLKNLIEEAKPRYRTITEMVSATLREAIIKGALKGGEAIRQDHIAQDFGVSRMPVREALRQLEAEGLIEFYPHRGTVVAKIDRGDVQEACEIRILLECHALKKSIHRLEGDDFDRAEDILEQIDRQTDPGQLGELNRRFHLTLYTGIKGGKLYELIQNQYLYLDRHVRLILTQLGYSEKSQKEHRELLAACRQGNTERATAILTHHIEESTRHLLALLDVDV